MRKYIIATLLIVLGIILLAYNYLNTNKNTHYSDTLFLKESKNFENKFISFINGVESNVLSLRENFNSVQKIKDTTFIKNYLFPLVKKDPYLISIRIINDINKLGIRKDKKSIVLAIDSTDTMDVVRWQRYENEKLISSWEESFEKEINKTAWFRKLKDLPNQTQWIFKNKKDSVTGELFYSGFSYDTDPIQSVIVMEFSRAKLLKEFGIDPDYAQVNFMIKTNQEKLIDLTNSNLHTDSLQISRLNHFKKFKEKDAGTFSFHFDGETYWNSFKKFPKVTGIQYYLLTVPEQYLKNLDKGKNSKELNKYALLLLFLGGIILLVKKRFFYISSKRIKIPPVKEILKEDENRYLEFKSSARWDYRQEKTNPELEKVILKTLAAFGNTDGGILLIGVDDDKNIIGLENDFKTLKKSTADYYEIHLRNILHNHMGVRYVSKNVRMQFENYDNQNIVCAIKILAANEPVFLKFKNKNGQTEEKFFVRSGNSSQEIVSIAEINDYINTRFKK